MGFLWDEVINTAARSTSCAYYEQLVVYPTRTTSSIPSAAVRSTSNSYYEQQLRVYCPCPDNARQQLLVRTLTRRSPATSGTHRAYQKLLARAMSGLVRGSIVGEPFPTTLAVVGRPLLGGERMARTPSFPAVVGRSTDGEHALLPGSCWGARPPSRQLLGGGRKEESTQSQQHSPRQSNTIPSPVPTTLASNFSYAR